MSVFFWRWRPWLFQQLFKYASNFHGIGSCIQTKPQDWKLLQRRHLSSDVFYFGRRARWLSLMNAPANHLFNRNFILIKAVNNGSLENVLDMLRIDDVQQGVNICKGYHKTLLMSWYTFFQYFPFCFHNIQDFIVFLLVPIVAIGFSIICVLVVNKNRNINKGPSRSNHGYTTLVSTDEAVVDIIEWQKFCFFVGQWSS